MYEKTTCQFFKEGSKKKIDAMKAGENKIAGGIIERVEGKYKNNKMRK
ncbi:hypothetical protein ACE41I_23085 [Bacillus cereus]